MPEYICPHCRNPINDDDALLCLYCGRNLNRRVGFMGSLKYPTRHIIIVIAVIIVLSGFVVMIMR